MRRGEFTSGPDWLLFARMIYYYCDNDDEPDDSEDGGNELLSARAPNSEG